MPKYEDDELKILQIPMSDFQFGQYQEARIQERKLEKNNKSKKSKNKLQKDEIYSDSVSCLLYTSPSQRDLSKSRMQSSD